MKPAALVFGERLLGQAMLPLRERIAKVTASCLNQDLYIDSLLGMHFDHDLQGRGSQSFLVFDFYRLFLFENSHLPDGPKVDSLVRCVIDDYPVQPLHVLAAYGRKQFHFFHPLEVLDILPLLWAQRSPGSVITVDFSSPEIRTARVSVHPECQRPCIETSAEQCLLAGQNASGLRDCFTGPGLRTGSKPNLDGFVSPDVGIIRKERRVMGQLSFPTAVTQIATGYSKSFFCAGRTTTMPDAVNIARCEAVERHQVNFLNRQTPLIYGNYENFHDVAVDPETLCFSAIRSAPNDRRTPYSAHLPFYWCAAEDPLLRQAVLVPAQEIWFDTNRLPNENLCFLSSTNGCALGGSFEEAALFALLETIERDAFLTTWYLRRSCAQIIPTSIRTERFQLLWRRLANVYRGYSIQLFDISNDVRLPVVLCAAIKKAGRGPKIMLSMACRLCGEDAALAALEDLAGTADPTSYDETRATELLLRPEDVFEPEDHAAFYSIPETFDRLAFLGLDQHPNLMIQEVNQDVWVGRQDRYNLKAVLEAIVCSLKDLGVRVLFKDLTHPEFHSRNLFCVRAIAPGLYPMWFGYYSIRFRMTERLQLLAKRFLGQRIAAEQINLDIHPFA